ncbi:MAG: hypothetical protein AABY93_08405 [Bacteroidota bacterium]
METVGLFQLKQHGVFVCHAAFMFVKGGAPKMSNHTGDLITDVFGAGYILNPGDLGVPDGSDVTLFLMVVAGTTVSAQESFRYVKESKNIAHYKSEWTSVDPKLHLERVS